MRVLILAVLLFAVPVAAQTDRAPAAAAPTAAPVVASTAKTPDHDKVICRTMQVTGSRLGGKRECMTRTQWDERARNDREEIDRMSRSASPKD